MASHASRGTLRDAVKFMWHTGCRPQELRIIEARWISGPVITIPKEFAKGKRKVRVIPLNPMARRIAARLAQQHPHGPIFRNERGVPFRKDGLAQSLRRACKRAGLKSLCPYAFRHGNITRLLERGVDIATVAAISGNSPRMVADWYNHVGNNHQRLLDVVNSTGQWQPT